MNDVRIVCPNHRPHATQISIDGLELTRVTRFVLDVGVGDEMTTLELTLAPDSIVVEGEMQVICTYVDPVTGETFTRETGLPEQETT